MEKAPVKHNRLRRMEKHSYTSACIYLITVTTTDRKRILGTLAGDSPDTAMIEPTDLGKYVTEAFRKTAAEVTKNTGCRVQVLHYQIMPDHFHGILYVRDTLPKDYSLGKIVAAWKSDCTHALWNDSSLCSQYFSSERPSLFSSGFNDRILFREGQLKTWIKYLDDNPRRLWLKMHSTAEKAVYDACYKEKLPLIHIVNRGLDGKFIYPSGRDLTGCSDGFLLVLAPYADYSEETAAKRITRAQCIDMNGYAEDLANIALKCDERNEE